MRFNIKHAQQLLRNHGGAYRHGYTETKHKNYDTQETTIWHFMTLIWQKVSSCVLNL
jgi:hypothetical protein